MNFFTKRKQREDLDIRLRAYSMSTKSNPLSELYLNTVGGGPQGHNVDKEAHLRVYFANAYAFAAIESIANAVSSVPIRVQRSAFDNGETIWETLEDHPLARLLKRPNDDEPIEYLMNKIVVSTLGSGDGYLFAPRSERELFTLRPHWVKVNTDKLGRRTGYEIKNGEIKSIVDPNEIIHFRTVNPTGDYYGMPASNVIKMTIRTKINLDKYVNNYFENNAMLGATFTTEQSLTPQQRAEMKQQIETLHKGADRAFRMAILDSGTKIDHLAHALKDLIPTEITNQIRSEILAAFKVPPIVIQSLDGASYANANIQYQLFYKNAVVPMMRVIETFFNLQYSYLFGEDIRIWFDRTTVPELQEDQDALTIRLNKQVGNKPIITQNEARAKLGYEAVEGGDSLSSPTPQGQISFGSPEDDEDDPEKMYHRAMNSDDPRMLAWADHYVKVTRKERTFLSLYRKFLNGQLGRVIKNLDELDLGDQDKTMNIARLKSMLLSMNIDYKGVSDDTKKIFDLKSENALLEAMMNSHYVDTITEAGQAGIAEVGGSIPFNVNNPKVQTALKLRFNQIKKTNATTFEQIKNVLSESYDQGYGLDKTAKLIKTKYREISKGRAAVIARTEMNGLVNRGHTLGYAEMGVEQKEWGSAFLSTSRQTHMDADGQVVPIDGMFEVGNSTMSEPSDGNGLPEDTINCYCRVFAHVE